MSINKYVGVFNMELERMAVVVARISVSVVRLGDNESVEDFK
jgi:hypothetical protein